MSATRPRCPYCRQLVLVAPARRGPDLQLDPEPSSDGRVVLRRAVSESGVELGPRLAHFLAIGEEPRDGEQLFTTHAHTCSKRPKDRDRERPVAGDDDGQRQLPRGDR